MAGKHDGNTAFDPGVYRDFTGYVNFAGTEGWVRGATFEMLPAIDLSGPVSRKWRKARRITLTGEERIFTFEHVFWHSGTWEGGTWEYGVWETGDWLGGTWKCGQWRSGTWHGGTWVNGFWLDGEWIGGEWIDGMRRVKDTLGGAEAVGIYNPRGVKFLRLTPSE